jgi:23S rRNA pseudouridine955/2504/2580 synthase
MHEITLGEAEGGQRLDRYLRKLLRDVPLGAIFKRLRAGDIRVDGKKVDGSLRLAAGMKVQLRLPAADLARIAHGDERRAAPPEGSRSRVAPELRPRIVHRDDDVLVIDKPAGLAVQPGTGRENEHLVAWLDEQRLGERSATFAPAPAHRLDRGTSGLVAIGLSPLGLRGLTAAFREDTVEKVYVAVVHGAPAAESGSIDAPLRVRTDAGKKEPKVVVDPAGQSARTDWRVVTRAGRTSLLRLVLHTGRTHQIRAHLAHLGHPIVGDERYGSATKRDGGGFLLHAAELAFPHPRTGERVHVESAAPAAFAAALRAERS